MLNKHNQIVCDQTGIILNDGVTLYPGYIEVTDNKLNRFISNDPLNDHAYYQPWILHNRIQYKKMYKTEPCDDKRLQNKHFISKKAMREYLKSLAKNDSA